jgi:hypothetical protein
MKILPVNIEELSFVLHRGPEMKMECYLDLRNGTILNIPTNEKLISRMHGKEVDPENLNHDFFIDQIITEKEYYLYIPDLFQQHIFNLMSAFTKSISNQNFDETDALWKTIQEKGGYSIFRYIITKNEELYDLYIFFRDHMYEQLAREWLDENNINPIPQNQPEEIN